MKPNSQISRQSNRGDGEASSSRPGSSHPHTDQAFQAPLSELRTGRPGKVTHPVFAPGFRDLSNEFLSTETKRTYLAEVLFFAVIVGVSAWPIASMVQALAQLPK